ncbi:MAG: hypothetical protein MI757_05000, partial [Pirellulales bacterium]|nr:hypothetical protein [Pirellulales bacterium]
GRRRTSNSVTPTRMAAQLSPELESLLDLLSNDWRLERLGSGRVRWGADLSYNERSFHLVCDRGYIEAYEVVDGRLEWIEPPV